jgi:two-component system cell cycle sensor histidine kinase/response regulator CckA
MASDAKRPVAAEDTTASADQRIDVAGINIAWHPDSGTCTFESLPVAMMWVDTTLAGLFSGVQAMVGTERYLLALQSEGRKSVEADWQVISRHADFREGFQAIARIAAVAGWGEWRLEALDAEQHECRFCIKNSWEGRYQRALGVKWGSGMLAGKLAGYCSRLFGTNCWADQISFIAAGDPCDEFVVRPSSRLLEDEIESLLAGDAATRADMAVALQRLAKEIEEHKRSAQALREREEHYRALVETTDTGYVIVDRNGVVLDANREYVRLTGRASLADVVGRSVFEWTAAWDQDSNDAAVRECLRQGFIRNFEVTYVDGKGKHTPVEINATVVGEQDDRRILTLCRDISARKQSEALLLSAQKLESLGVLAGGIAHDFNNLLTGVFGHVDIARLSLPAGSEARENLDRAISVFGRVRALTQQLLTFAKGGAPAKECISLANLLQTTVRFTLSGSNVKPSLDIQDGLWACDADGSQVGQVLDNILINARQAMPLGGTIFIVARNVAEPSPVPVPLTVGRYVRISVRDQGIGIPPDILPRIFDPFFTTKQQGSGLGLATAYSIVKRHGGHIYAESEPARGATFEIYLPAARGQPDASGSGDPVLTRRPGQRVLLMDDEAFVLETGGHFLTELGCQVTCARDGAEAVARYQEALAGGSRFDLVILDLTIPGGMGGREAQAAIARLDPTAVIVASSGYSDDPVMASPQEHGFHGKLPKPYLRKDVALLFAALATSPLRKP